MDGQFPRDWMWSEAFAMLARVDRLHREFFRPAVSSSRQPTWEPPVDILETAGEVLVFVALPGVDIAHVEAAIDGADLIIAGTRQLPGELSTAVIHRLELPQGRFERRIRLRSSGERRDSGRPVAGCGARSDPGGAPGDE